MSLKEIVEQTCKEQQVKLEDLFIGEWVGDGLPVFPEFADEMLETHSNKEVVNSLYLEDSKLLVVVFNN